MLDRRILKLHSQPEFRPQAIQPITEPLEVLLESVLHELGPVLNLAQVRVDPSHHLLESMAEFAGRRMDALRTDQSGRGRP
jgi:hypothetical protein